MQIHGNPGDYAWGRGGLDAIITQVSPFLEILTILRKMTKHFHLEDSILTVSFDWFSDVT
jgi:hypothetical protein